MIIRQLFEKLAQGTPLSGVERQELVLWAERINTMEGKVNNWSQAGISTIKASALTGDPYMEALYLMRASAQSIPDSVETFCSWTSIRANGGAVEWILSDPTKLSRPRGQGLLGVIGKVEFPNNGTGRRAVTLNMYDSSHAQLYGETLMSLPASGVSADTLPFAAGVWFVDESPAYFKVGLHQNSGGALNMNFATIAIFKMDWMRV